MEHSKSIKNILLIFLMILVFYLMATLSKILLPLIIAFLFAMLFQPIIIRLSKFKLPNIIILPIVAVITLGFLYLVTEVVWTTVNDIIAEQDFLIARFNEKFAAVLAWYNKISGSRFRTGTFFTQMYKQVDKQWLTEVAKNLFGSITSFSGDFFWFSIYYVVLLAGIPNYQKYFRFVGGDKGEELLINYENIQKSVMSYMMLKTLINLLLGFGVFVVCLVFDVKFALFWGFIMFLLHYIPSIGAIIATFPPILMCALQSESIAPIAIVAALLVAMQFIVGNMLEPKVMGTKLKINTLTVIFGLVFWGYIWGIAGMLLSVPMLVIMKLILEKIPDMSVVARLMGSPTKLHSVE